MKREYKKWLTAALAASMLAMGAFGTVSATVGSGANGITADKKDIEALNQLIKNAEALNTLSGQSANLNALAKNANNLNALSDQKGTLDTVVANQTGKNIAIGEGAATSSYVDQHGQIAIGEKALAWSGSGSQERYLRFGQTGVHFDWSSWSYVFDDGSKLPASIAIGKGSVARSGSVTIGDHGYQGKLGDIEISGSTASDHMKYQQDALATTIGTNSYGNGALSAVTGAYSIISSKYDGTNNRWHAVQNTGATIYGSLNSIESASSDSLYSGTASSVLGFANRTQNANAALIWGSGNEITNSIESVSISYEGWGDKSVSEAQRAAIAALQTSDYAGGSVMAIGGGNKADYAKYSQMLGVQNKITGTEKDASKFDVLDGYKNTVTNASNVTLIGTLNEVAEGAHYNKVIGDNHKIASGKTHNVILGSADKVTEHSARDAVVIGHNAQANEDKSVAIGSGSVAEAAVATKDVTINGKTYAFAGISPIASFSVGAAGAERTITHVAAGRISATSTDAINGSQLYATNQALDKLNKKVDDLSVTIKGDGNIKVDDKDSATKKFSDGTTDSGSTGGGSGSTSKTEGNVKFDLSLNKEKIDLGNVTIEGTKGNIKAKTVNAETVNADTVNAETVNAETVNAETVNADTFKAGDTAVTKDGIRIGSDAALTKDTLKVDGKTYINGDGINANSKKITNVADGTISSTSKDAVNGSQLYAVDQKVENNTININKLGNRVDRVGAGAAALAALHPLDFDPDAKWDFAAGYGNYRGAHATALGAFYRPNEDWMLSFAGSFGGGENMVNAGVSIKVGAGSSHVNTSKVAMAKEIKELRGTVAAQDARLAAQDEKIARLTALVNSLVGADKALPAEEAAEAPAEAAEYFTVDEVTLADQASKGKTAERVRAIKAE